MSSRAERVVPVVTTHVTVVVSEACHFCQDADRALTDLAAAYPLVVRTVDVRTPEGTALMRTHRASMSPLVLVDGVFFSHGRLPRRKLRKRLIERYSNPDARRVAQVGGRRG